MMVSFTLASYSFSNFLESSGGSKVPSRRGSSEREISSIGGSLETSLSHVLNVRSVGHREKSREKPTRAVKGVFEESRSSEKTSKVALSFRLMKTTGLIQR